MNKEKHSEAISAVKHQNKKWLLQEVHKNQYMINTVAFKEMKNLHTVDLLYCI